MGVAVLASAWKQVSYDLVFFLAGLQAIPRTVTEAARMDGAGPLRFLRDILLPMSGPNLAALFVILFVYG